MCETLHVGDIPLVVGFQPTGVGVVCTDKGCPSVVCIAETLMFGWGYGLPLCSPIMSASYLRLRNYD